MTVLQQLPGQFEPFRLAGDLMQRQQALGDVAVVLQDAGVRARLPVAGDAQQPNRAVGSLLDVHVAQQPSARGAAATQSGSSNKAPASASAAIARPFQAATTLSSRVGCGRSSRAALSLARIRS